MGDLIEYDAISQDQADLLLDQYIAKQITRSDFWSLLGFDFSHENQPSDPEIKHKYLINQKKTKNVAHIFINGDTACRRYLSGGLGLKQKFMVSDSPQGRPVCLNCLAVING